MILSENSDLGYEDILTADVILYPNPMNEIYLKLNDANYGNVKGKSFQSAWSSIRILNLMIIQIMIYVFHFQIMIKGFISLEFKNIHISNFKVYYSTLAV